MAFLEDCLLKANELTHHSDAIQEDEELSPTVENFVHSVKLPKKSDRFHLRRRPPDETTDDYCTEPEVSPDPPQEHSSLRIQVRRSPYLDTFYRHRPVRVVVDSGTTGNMIRMSTVKLLGLAISASAQSAHQADGSSPLRVMGETRFELNRNHHKFLFEGLVVENLDVEVLAGTPFMECNDIAIRPAKREITLKDGTTVLYGSRNNTPIDKPVCRALVLRAPATPTTIWPGEYLELQLPDDAAPDAEYALELRLDSPFARATTAYEPWPQPNIISSVAGKIRLPNLSGHPQTLKRNEHFGQVSPVFEPNKNEGSPPITPKTSPASLHTSVGNHSDKVQLDPDNLLSHDIKSKFRALLEQYDCVFDPAIKGYNGSAGPLKARVNMGPVEPPQRKGRLPQYARNKLVELQQKFDDLEATGVFRRPEDAGVDVEYLNPSFLVSKRSGGSRLVTAFSDVGRYSKPQPSLMPNVDTTLRLIAQWNHIIKSDLTSAFYQIPLARESMKYCGIATPFKGIRVYARAAMGMPGSETALEELMCRVLGELLQRGVVAKIADDLYCGGNNPTELLENWGMVLKALYRCDLRLSASKTVINPKSTTILGWRWTQGTLQACPHRIAALSTCSPPNCVTGMRSFIGAYKVLARVIPRCASLLAPLEDAIAGRQSSDPINWTDELSKDFTTAQTFLSSNRTITLPKPNDQLWIVTDGAVRKPGIGATLYITREGKLILAGFFSAKLRDRQVSWLPCEVEALAIAVATKHFSPYIIQSRHKASILTDSKPCVQAFEKLCRGEFSASPRVSTFLSTVSRYQATVQHVAGAAILPSDFASRNAPDCNDMSCQVCSFIKQTEDSVIRHLSVEDILKGTSKLPFTSRAAWQSIQAECADLRRTHAHLTQGTRPSKKLTNIKDIKRYLNVATIASDGLLLVQGNEPLSPPRQRIIVPRQVLEGLLTALHIKLQHPSSHQLRSAANRYFFALDMDKAIDHVTKSCHPCAALKKTPKSLIEQSTNPPPDAVGTTFAADVIKRARQLILVLRECSTSYTQTLLLSDECKDTLRDALIRLCVEMRPLDGPPAVIRTDPAPGFKALTEDKFLHQQRITLEIGRVKNPNKNPVAEKAIQELENELLRLDPLGGSISSVTLAIATATLNARIRSRGLSAREMWMQRDQFSNHQIPLSDQELVLKQHDLRNANHPYSEKSKAPLKKAIDAPQVEVGDLVYLYLDRNKSCSRDRYLVTSTEGIWCNIRKFTGSQLRKTSYRVKASECYKVPNHMSLNRSSYRTPQHDSSDDESTTPGALPSPPELPEVPRGISTPPTPHSHFPTDNFHELVATPPATVDNEDHLNTITSPTTKALEAALIWITKHQGSHRVHIAYPNVTMT
ncbi:hypothetical protein QZH41_018836, partial [Actinostola sp. cb2023]